MTSSVCTPSCCRTALRGGAQDQSRSSLCCQRWTPIWPPPPSADSRYLEQGGRAHEAVTKGTSKEGITKEGPTNVPGFRGGL